MDSLGDRMKKYEDAYRIKLPGRMPVIIRVDGKAFHTLTRQMDRPFDRLFSSGMREVAASLFSEIQGAKLCYQQSDEVSVLVTNYDRLETQSWFDNNLQKIVSVSASIATSIFNYQLDRYLDELAEFDARAFVLPREEVCNYFIWRQQDCVRNSIQLCGQAEFSPSQLHGKSCDEIRDMLTGIGKDWGLQPDVYRKGFCVYTLDGSAAYDHTTPYFTEDRDYIEQHVYIDKEEN